MLLLKNKKGAFAGAADIILFAGLVLILLVLVGIFNTAAAAENVGATTSVLQLDANEDVLTLLRSTVNYDDQEISFGHLVELSQNQGQEELERGILKESHELLDPVVGENNWAINICYEDKGSHDSKCWLYLNSNRWSATVKGPKGNLESEGSITFIDQKSERVTVTLRLLK